MSAALERGTRVGPYAIEALLGMGGMGAVYRARDTRLGREVALKVVRPGRVDRTGVDPSDRLLAEAQAAAALRHRHIVEVYDAGVADGQTYVAMEYVEGRPLRSYVGDPSVSLDVRLRWLREVASALGAAHQAGLVHRDVKPENVMIDAEGRARVLDFGIAKRFAHDASAPTAERPLHLETAEGRVIGTAAYMAPEHLAGGAPDPRWDQFAWGVMAYELLTGMHPRQAVAMPGATAHFTQTPRLPSEVVPGLPFEVSAAVLRAMAPDAALRLASMGELAAALGSPVPVTPPALPPSVPRAPDAAAAPVALAPGERGRRSSRAPLLLALSASLALAGLGAAALALALVLRSPPPAAAFDGGAPAVAPSTVASAAVRVDATATTSTPAPPSAVPDGGGAQAAAPRPPASAATPTAFLTRCQCLGDDGPLCPLSSDRSLRSCWCADSTGEHLRTPSNRDFDFRGRGLVNGQPCEGFFNSERRTGTYTLCQWGCDLGAFSGQHRGPCRGLDRTFAEEPGRLSCY